jgi:hypothetical protein
MRFPSNLSGFPGRLSRRAIRHDLEISKRLIYAATVHLTLAGPY